MNLETFLMLLATWAIVAVTVHYCLRHRHKWRATAVDHGVISEPRRNATAILYVCASCGEAKSTTVAGTYRIEDVRIQLQQPSTNRYPAKSFRWSPSDKLFARSLKVKL